MKFGLFFTNVGPFSHPDRFCQELHKLLLRGRAYRHLR